MAAAGFVVAPDKDFGPAIEIEDLGRNLGQAGQPVDQLDEPRGGKIAVAHVDAKRDGARQGRAVQQAGDQAEGQVVDDLIPQVFKRVQHG